MGRFQRSWKLFNASLEVIAGNKQLIVFPILISVMMAVIVLFFLAPVALIPTGYSLTQSQHWVAVGQTIFAERATSGDGPPVALTPAAMAYVVFLYLMSMFFATFFNVAFYNEILVALSGRPVSIVHGLKFAVTRLKPILMWSLLAGVVGLAIKSLEQRFGVVGRLVVRLIGAAWSIASVFAIPIIVRDDQAVNPVKTLKESAAILRRTWGEGLIGYIGLSFVSALVFGVSILFVLAALFLSITLNNFWIVAVGAAVWFMGIFAFGYMISLASQVYKGALFLYAADGFVAQPYDQQMLDTAWKFKRKS